GTGNITRASACGGGAGMRQRAASTTITCGWSWYNFLNCNGGCFSPCWAWWGCHSSWSFGFGFNWCNSWGSFSFCWGNPCWWWWPASYSYPYYYPYYVPSVSYPIYYPVYYPASYPSTVDSSVAYPQESNQAPARSDSAPLQEGDTPRVSGARTSPAALADRYVTLGDLYFRVGSYDRAASSYAKAVSLDPTDPNLRFI